MSDMQDAVYLCLQDDGHYSTSRTKGQSKTKYIRADLVPTQALHTEPPLSVRDQVSLAFLSAMFASNLFAGLSRSIDPETIGQILDHETEAFLAIRKEKPL